MNDLKLWWLAIRPKTLTAALVPVVVSVAWVRSQGTVIQWWIPLFALLSSFCIQIATNLINDAIDFKKGADTDERIGPVRVTQKGFFKEKQVMALGISFLVLATLLGIPLVLHGGLPVLIVGLVSLFLGYGYTGGPFPLAYLGLGDPFVVLFFGLIPVSTLCFLMQGFWDLQSMLLGLQVGLHATVLIAINNLRDWKGDVQVGKKTLPVRWGVRVARIEIALAVLIPFLLSLSWVNQARPWAAFLPILSAPLAIQLVKLIFETEPSPAYNKFLARAAGLHLVFGILLAVGLLC